MPTKDASGLADSGESTIRSRHVTGLWALAAAMIVGRGLCVLLFAAVDECFEEND